MLGAVLFYSIYGNVNSHVRIRRVEVCGYIGLGPGGNAPRHVGAAVEEVLTQHEKRQTRSASNAQIVINLLIFFIDSLAAFHRERGRIKLFISI